MRPAFVDPRFAIEDFEPLYVALHRAGELAERVEAAVVKLGECRACPRDCRVDRLAGETAICHTGRHAIVASAFSRFGEEECFRGWNGSGTIFFAFCNFRCVSCQNWDICQQVPQRTDRRELHGSNIGGCVLSRCGATDA